MSEFFLAQIVPNLSQENQIPDTVLADILKVYEFGKEQDLKSIPNDLICLRDGRFWTTWRKVFDIRTALKKESKDAI